jgi:hypothetical protein
MSKPTWSIIYRWSATSVFLWLSGRNAVAFTQSCWRLILKVRERNMDSTVLILIIVLVLLFGGGGGYFWSRGRR